VAVDREWVGKLVWLRASELVNAASGASTEIA
jgi:hypothetical protein